MPELQGFIGCVRGLKIGDNLIDLAAIAEENIAHGKWGDWGGGRVVVCEMQMCVCVNNACETATAAAGTVEQK